MTTDGKIMAVTTCAFAALWVVLACSWALGAPINDDPSWLWFIAGLVALGAIGVVATGRRPK